MTSTCMTFFKENNVEGRDAKLKNENMEKQEMV
jgi:hypothetical protein